MTATDALFSNDMQYASQISLDDKLDETLIVIRSCLVHVMNTCMNAYATRLLWDKKHGFCMIWH